MRYTAYKIYLCSLQDEIEQVAAAHPTDRPDPCPLAKNFKIPKVVAVCDDTMLQPDLEEACQLMREVSLDVEAAKPPVYADQGQTRGRKPKRSKLDKVKKVSKNSKRKRNGKGKGKGKGKKNNGKTLKGSEVDGKSDSHSREALAATPSIKKRKVSKTKNDSDTAPVAEVEPESAGPAVKPRKRKSSSAAAKRPAKKPVPTPVRSEAMSHEVDGEPASSSAASAPEVVPAEAPPAPEVELEDLENCSKPADAIAAPDHCSTNGVYSAAYRRAKAATGDPEKAKHVA